MSNTTAARGDAGRGRQEADATEAKATLARPSHCGRPAPSGGGVSQGLPPAPPLTARASLRPFPVSRDPSLGGPSEWPPQPPAPALCESPANGQSRAQMTGWPGSDPVTSLPTSPSQRHLIPSKSEGLGG